MDEGYTGLLRLISNGDEGAEAVLYAEAYQHLKKLARRVMYRSPVISELEPTGVLHEAYVRLSRRGKIPESTKAFFIVFSRIMLDVLVEDARHRGAAKRGSGQIRVPLDDGALGVDSDFISPLAFAEFIDHIDRTNKEASRCILLRMSCGLTLREIADVTGISLAKVRVRLAEAKKQLAEYVLEISE